MPDKFLMLLQNEPEHIILYDPDPSFLRNVEVYCDSVHPRISVRLYLLVHAHSVEEMRYFNELSVENDNFDRLISQVRGTRRPALGTGRRNGTVRRASRRWR